MSTVFAERPSFFEGQYLGADDLEAFLKYAREYDARHLLGAHTWASSPASNWWRAARRLARSNISSQPASRWTVMGD